MPSVTWPQARYQANTIRTLPVSETADVFAHVDSPVRPPSSTPPASTTPYRPPSSLRAAEYRLRLYDLTADGHMEPLDELDGDASDVELLRNNTGSFRIRFRPTANGARWMFDGGKLRDESLLVQLWRQNKPIITGRPDQPTYDPSTGWYEVDVVEHGPTELGDATLGDAEADNLARNGDFSSGFDWWPGVVNVTRSIVWKRGRRAAKLVGSGGVAYMYQIARIPPPGSSGNLIRVAATVAVDSGDHLPAFGLGIRALVFEDGKLVREMPPAFVEKRGGWYRVTTQDVQNVGVTTEVEVQVWAPDGDPIYARRVKVGRPDNTGVSAGRDLGQYAAEIVRAAAARGRYRWGRKVTLPIRELPDGKTARHDRHPLPIDELHDCEPWMDWHFEHATPTSLRFRAYPPRVTPRTDLVLTPDTCDGLKWSQPALPISRVIITGDAGDYLRDEGQATDTSAFGGRTRDLVESAPPATDPDDLEDVAARRLRQVNETLVAVDGDPASSLSSPVHVSGEWVHYLNRGDVVKAFVPVEVNEIGTVTLASVQRIVGLKLDPSADRLALTLESVGADAQP